MEATKLENYTYDDYLAIDRSTQERVELIFGEIHMMAGASAEHQDMVLNIAAYLKEAASKSYCRPRIAPFDLKLQCDAYTHVVQPDVMLFCDNAPLPCAVFEVLSPSTALKDKSVKKELYERCGIRAYYIVDLTNRVIDFYRLHSAQYIYVRGYGEEDRMPLACLEGEGVSVADLFEGIASQVEANTLK